MMNAAPSGRVESVVAALDGQGRRPLIEFIQGQRWFGGKDKPLADVRLLDVIGLVSAAPMRALAVLCVEYRGGGIERYVVPVVVRPKSGPDDRTALAALSGTSTHDWVCDATGEAQTWRCLYDVVGQEKELAGQSGCLRGQAMPQGRELLSAPIYDVHILSAEQSNTSVAFDRRVIVKLIRKLDAGVNPDSEVLEFLTTQTACPDVPTLLGVMTYDDGLTDTAPATVAVFQRFIPNCGDGWSYTLRHLETLLDEGGMAVTEGGEPVSKVVEDRSGPFLIELRQLGKITGGLHVALASRQEPAAFCPEPITLCDVETWQAGMMTHAADVCRELRALPPDRQTVLGLTGDEVAALEAASLDRFGALHLLSLSLTLKIRHHGDLHLGQILKTQEGFAVIDFEGEPARPIEERRGKVCPLKDVAGLLRSLNYAAHAALKQRAAVSPVAVALMREWEQAARLAFLDGYRAVAEPGHADFMPVTWNESLRVIQAYELDKAFYELRYEMRNRPEWLPIPLGGIRALVG